MRGAFWGRGAGRDLIVAVGTMAPGFFSGGLPLVVCSAFSQIGYYSYARERKGTTNY